MSTVDVSKTFGALLLGALSASVLTGVTSIQALLYFMFYGHDPQIIKALVIAVWALDTAHTAFIWISLWHHFITDFGQAILIDDIPWSIALSVVFTAVLTFLVHGFLAHRIFLLSRKNWFLTTPILLLAVLRLASASTTCAEMIKQKTYSQFRDHVAWVFTLGLSLSSAVDILISISLFILLSMSRRPGLDKLNATIDALILYAFETGTLTCAATLLSLICWIAMPTNLVFLSLHFIIGKFYANSLLVTLNTRRKLRRGGQEYYISRGTEVPDEPVLFLNSRRGPDTTTVTGIGSNTEHTSELGHSSAAKSMELHINVERSIEYTIEPNRQRGSQIFYEAARRKESLARIRQEADQPG